MNNDSTRKRRVQKTLGLHYSRFYLIARCIDSLFRRKILENRSSAAPVEKVGLTLASPCEKACEAWIQTAQGCNDHCRHEGDRLAAALGPWLLCWRGAQEARLDTDIGEGRGRTRLSRGGRPAVQIEVEDRRTIGRLAMAS